MFPGSPTPLPPCTSLRRLLQLLPPGQATGVWLRQCRSLRVLHAPGGRYLLLSYDLGTLLRRCEWIAVRHGAGVAVLSAAQLVRCRVLEIVLGTPFLPPPAQLRALFPTVSAGRTTWSVPIGLASAEEALAICAAERVPVRATHIGYAATSG